jgi:cytochrome c-type biogenesis protein CcmH/NrfG
MRVLPGLLSELEQAESRIAAPAPLLIRPVAAALRQRREARRVKKLIRHAVAMAATKSAELQQQSERLIKTASRYAGSRLMATRRVAEFEACERLFAAWHVLHLPLFVMLVIVGIVHVVAVNVY